MPSWNHRICAAFLGIVLSITLLTAVTARPAAAEPSSQKILVTLNRPVYTIRCDTATGAPQMPTDVTATAEALHWPDTALHPACFIWSVTLTWHYMGCRTRHDIGSRKFIQPSPLHIDFGDQIRGGTLTVMARTKWHGHWITGTAQALVLGANPDRETVLRAFPISRFGWIASKIATWESGLHQFAWRSGAHPVGWPYVSPTGDIGLMQLNAPTGAISSPNQVWDWRANVRRGLAILADKRLDSYRAAIQSVGKRQWTRPPLSDEPGSGILAGDPDLDHTQLSQLERDFIRRYNAGHEYTYLPSRGGNYSRGCWRLDVNRGGLSRRIGDPDYVRHVLNSRSGFVWPPAPPMPPKARRRRHHRHHTRRPWSVSGQYNALLPRRFHRTTRQQINTTL